jgi:tetratricopeptide (TPR) repeat protein
MGEIVTAIGETYARNGEFRKAHGYLEEAARLADLRGDRRDTVLSTLSLARCEAASGEKNRALATWERAKSVAAEFNDPVIDCELEKCLCLVYFQVREFQSSAEHAERAIEIAREYGLTYEFCVNAHNSGDAWLRAGDYKKAFTAIMTSLAIAQEHGFEKMTRLNNVYMAFIDASRFGSDEGRAKVEAALAYAESHAYAWDVLQAKYLLGVLAKEQGDPEKAKRLLREALALANETDNRMYAEDCEMLLREVTTLPPAPPR